VIFAGSLCGQPKAGTVQDQYPVMQIDGKYFTMSLRMMKAVWYYPFLH
jgi:hypothetical protein